MLSSFPEAWEIQERKFKWRSKVDFCVFDDIIEEYKDIESVFFVIDENVFSNIQTSLQCISKDRVIIVEDLNEDNKNIYRVMMLIEDFSKAGIDRSSSIIAVGGGVLTDVVGFAASIYQRGVKEISYVPTTLLSMIDAGLGGKTGVNFLNIKNFIGTFIDIKSIFIDISFLQTLPDEEMKNAIGELQKYYYLGINSANIKYEKLIQEKIEDPSYILAKLIGDCLTYKSNIVGNDPNEKGNRKVLNLGHTFGHAFEYCGLNGHGKAILLGLIYELYFAMVYYGNSQNLYLNEIKRLRKIEKHLFENLFEFEYSSDDLLAAILNDKKRNSSYIEMPLISFDNSLKQIKIEKIELSVIHRFLQSKEFPCKISETKSILSMIKSFLFSTEEWISDMKFKRLKKD